MNVLLTIVNKLLAFDCFFPFVSFIEAYILGSTGKFRKMINKSY